MHIYPLTHSPYPMYELHYFVRWVLPVILYWGYAHTIGDSGVKKRAIMLRKVEGQISKFSSIFRYFVENVWVFSVSLMHPSYSLFLFSN